MHHSSSYHKAHVLQRHDAEEIIAEYSHKIQWRTDGRDSLLDIGTGPGDVLMDLIYTIMPKDFTIVIGSDISPEMINYAKEFYKTYEKCDFKILDIGTKNDLPADMKEQFDHVTSFYCLHWIQNKKLAMKNIFDLLKPEGGDIFLVFLASNPIYDVYKALSKTEKWSSYMTDVNQFINPLHYSPHPDKVFSTILKEQGFSDVQVETKTKFFRYKGVEALIDNVKPLNPFLARIPPTLHNSHLNDFLKAVDNLNLIEKPSSNPSEYIINFQYKLIVAFAKKRGNGT